LLRPENCGGVEGWFKQRIDRDFDAVGVI